MKPEPDSEMTEGESVAYIVEGVLIVLTLATFLALMAGCRTPVKGGITGRTYDYWRPRSGDSLTTVIEKMGRKPDDVTVHDDCTVLRWKDAMTGEDWVNVAFPPDMKFAAGREVISIDGETGETVKWIDDSEDSKVLWVHVDILAGIRSN